MKPGGRGIPGPAWALETLQATGEASFLNQWSTGYPLAFPRCCELTLGSSWELATEGPGWGRRPRLLPSGFEEQPNLTSCLPGFCDSPFHRFLLCLRFFGSQIC